MKREPKWLSLAAILAIHDRLIAEFGGEAGVRAPDLLESALASPRDHFAYGERDLFVLAAAYASALSRDHPFLDGNKRAALTVAVVFLERNGKRFEGTQEEAVQFMVALASGALASGELADWLRQSSAREVTTRGKSAGRATKKARSSKKPKKRS